MARPPGVDDATAWRALVEAVRKQPTPPRAPWRTHSRLKDAACEAGPGALLLAHDRLVLPWQSADGAWRNLPRGAGQPDCVKRFLCVPSLAAWLAYEAHLSPACRCFYEVLREATPVRYWLDLDLPLSDALQARLGGTPDCCRAALACMLEVLVVDAVCRVTDAAPGELRVVVVDGDGSAEGRAPTQRVSLHVLCTGALLPDNEHAGSAVRLEVMQRIRAAARDDAHAAAAALVQCCVLELSSTPSTRATGCAASRGTRRWASAATAARWRALRACLPPPSSHPQQQLAARSGCWAGAWRRRCKQRRVDAASERRWQRTCRPGLAAQRRRWMQPSWRSCAPSTWCVPTRLASQRGGTQPNVLLTRLACVLLPLLARSWARP
jgi:hypothetical protein